MLSEFYTDKIQIKYNRSGDDYAGYTYSSKFIDCAIQHKRKKVIAANGDEVVSKSTMFTEESLDEDDLIVYNSRDREILSISEKKDHFGGGDVDHYEINF